MAQHKLFMVMMGCTPVGRHTEQHDIFFGIGERLSDLVEDMKRFWPESNGIFHIDVWREVNVVDGYTISVVPRGIVEKQLPQLFFVNLGGYMPNVFDEPHYKLLTVQENLAKAVQAAKATAFYKHTGFKGAVSHIDDQYGVDVDDLHVVDDILPSSQKQHYGLMITPNTTLPEDVLHVGYLKLSKLVGN
jgi:hypothetical protein